MSSRKRNRDASPFFRGFRQRLRLLTLVVGVFLLLAAGLFLALAAVSHPPQDGLLIAWAGGFAAAGGLIVLARGLLFVFPEYWRRRQSPSRRMRRAQSDRRHARPPHPSAGPEREGGALVLVLILVGLVAALLVQTHTLARTRAMLVRHEDARAALRLAAADAVLAALQRLADDEDLGADGTNEAWAARREYETPLGVSVRSQVRDGQARFDLNNLHLPPAPLRRAVEDIVMDLQTLCGEFSPGPATVALRDFVDADQNGPREAAFYRQTAPARRCADRPLYGWRELLAVDGWDETRLQRRPREAGTRGFNASLVDHVALIPSPRTHPVPLNVNTAGREALLAVMGFEQERLVETVLTLRAIRPIRQLDVFSVMVGPEVFDRFSPYLDVRSRFFIAEARAYRDGRAATVESWVRRQEDGRVEILQWLEGADG